MGKPEFTYNVPTTPLTHWPFRQQTTEQTEVSPEVILMGWPKTQASSTRFCSILCASRSSSQPVRSLSLHNAQFPLTRDDSSPYRIAVPWPTRNSLLCSILNLQYHAPQLLWWCDIASLRYPTATAQGYSYSTYRTQHTRLLYTMTLTILSET